ncbi:hypothetical protein DIS24_g8255 [Lasiodiplodia hormozganensis]|uniref:Uncharacterized protein n=1 Tax=Lasiodiplodia hormozganensis TaxID=869390 RepID=A0AA39Y461_9PEZI|nr:hypothetical protein DIS24_g8255 [Lasiodiplodia hormozganensis]
MSDSTYSRVDMGNSEVTRTTSSDLDKPRNWHPRGWKADYLTQDNLAQSARSLKRATTAAVVSPLTSDEGVRKLRRHAFALLTVAVFGILPLAVYFSILDTPFAAKPVTCGGVQVEEDGTSGIESLFTVDRTAGSFPFWLAKLLDTVWDLFVARGMQFLAAIISYVVFCNAMLRALEASPVPYRTFTGLALNGASLGTVVSLLRDLRRHDRARTVWLFAYGAVALTYVLAMPTLFSTMTGYVSVSSPFTMVPGTSQFVPTDSFKYGYSFTGLPEIEDGTCLSTDSVYPTNRRDMSQRNICNNTCVTHFWNGTHKDLATGEIIQPRNATAVNELLTKTQNCSRFDNETYSGVSLYYPGSPYYYPPEDDPTEYNNPDNIQYNCTATITLSIANHNIPYDTAMAHSDPFRTQCYNGTGYSLYTVEQNSRCLPDTAASRPAYQWGFSAMLTSVVLIVHAVWALTLYAVWLDAECRGDVVRREGEGGTGGMTQLRAAWFAVAAARGVVVDEEEREARDAGMGCGPEEVEGMAGRQEAKVGVGLFEEACVRERGGKAEEVRREGV